jgi:hypothetical protein
MLSVYQELDLSLAFLDVLFGNPFDRVCLLIIFLFPGICLLDRSSVCFCEARFHFGCCRWMTENPLFFLVI